MLAESGQHKIKIKISKRNKKEILKTISKENFGQNFTLN